MAAIIAPDCEIIVNGNNLELKGAQISRVEVDLTTGFEASGCEFEIINGYDEKTGEFDGTWYDQIIQPGKTVEIKLGDITKESVFYGYIDSINSRFDSEVGVEVIVSCLDAKGAMMAGRHKNIAVKKKLSEVVQTILNKYCSGWGATSCSVDATTDTFDHLHFNYQTDYELLVTIARRVNFEFYVLDKVINFKKRISGGADFTLTWGMDVISLTREVSLKGQLGEVTVVGNDELKTEVITGKADSIDVIRTKTAKSTLSKVGDWKEIIYDPSVRGKGFAETLAKSILNERAMGFVSCHGECCGDPKLKPGKYMELKRFDSNINGKYYIKKVKHVFDENGYFTKFELGANSI